MTTNTYQEFSEALKRCRDIFAAKLHDYAPSWRVMRPSSITDQIFIKAKRIRSLQVKGHAMVDEGIMPEFMGIVNYCIIALIQLRLGTADSADISGADALSLYDEEADRLFNLMKAKNHDYDEAWRDMRVSSYVDLILTKIMRIRQIEDNHGNTLVSEGVDGNYMDMANYSVFGIIQLTEAETQA
jgi:hypothetical protein